MKNFIIGLMLGIWAGPVFKEVARRVVIKMHESTEAN